LKASEQRLKRLAAVLVQRQEVERKFVAMQIHEQIAQSLSAIKMTIEAALSDKAGIPLPVSRDLLAVIAQLKETIDLIRRLTRRLSPIMLDDLGLRTAIEDLCREVMQTNGDSQIITRIDADERLIPDALKLVIYRVLQELLALLVVQFHEDRWIVSLKKSSGRLSLVVQGPQPPHAALQSEWELGIAAVRNRIDASGGSLALSIPQEKKARITARWPLSATGDHGGDRTGMHP
jgi:signal transduction histidine kinase